MSVFDVGFEVGGLRKRLGANVALERPKATVRIGVALQLGRGDEGLTTFLAFVTQPTIQATTAAAVSAANQTSKAATAAAAAATTQVTIATSEDLLVNGMLSNRIEVTQPI